MEYHASTDGAARALDHFASVVLQHAGEAIAASDPNSGPDPEILNGDQLDSILHGQQSGRTGLSRTASPSIWGHSTLYSNDEYTNDPRFVASQRELRDLLFTSAHSRAPTRTGSPIDTLTAASPIHSSTRTHNSALRDVISNRERVAWLRNYLDEVAPWLDMFDASQHFGLAIPILAQSSVPLVYAMLAISTRQIERKKKLRGHLDSLELYQESIRSLTPQLLAGDPNVLATCVILCVLEMMSASPWNWQKHLDGCAALFLSHNVNGLSGGLPQAVFWCYARMDVCAAIISGGNGTLVLPLESWLPPDVTSDHASRYFRAPDTPDMWANYAVYLVAKTCHLMWLHIKESSDMAGSEDENNFVHSWCGLWAELQSWRQERPFELRELDFDGEIQNSQLNPFPFILFAASCAISSNQLYHAACLLLLEMKPPSIQNRQLGHAAAKLWHARRICGISITNEHHGCLNNAIQPLWLAGKFLSHPTEHKVVIDLITTIEMKTGWSVQWRIGDLKEIWGYDRNSTI